MNRTFFVADGFVAAARRRTISRTSRSIRRGARDGAEEESARGIDGAIASAEQQEWNLRPDVPDWRRLAVNNITEVLSGGGVAFHVANDRVQQIQHFAQKMFGEEVISSRRTHMHWL
jgi:hypothetical protein